jgi:DNA-binding NarL/FixJ family response regulator
VELSPRELEVVSLLLDGLSNAEIAARLVVSTRTVHAHVSNALRKTGTRSRLQLAVHILRMGVLPLNPSAAAVEYPSPR